MALRWCRARRGQDVRKRHLCHINVHTCTPPTHTHLHMRGHAPCCTHRPRPCPDGGGGDGGGDGDDDGDSGRDSGRDGDGDGGGGGSGAANGQGRDSGQKLQLPRRGVGGPLFDAVSSRPRSRPAGPTVSSTAYQLLLPRRSGTNHPSLSLQSMDAEGRTPPPNMPGSRSPRWGGDVWRGR